MTDDEALVELRIRWGERGFRQKTPYGVVVGYITNAGYPKGLGYSENGWEAAFLEADLSKVHNCLPN